MKIDPRAVVAPGAKLAPDVEIGAYTIIGPDVEIGPGCVIGPHAVITGWTTLGANNRVFQFASIGDAPQDKKYAGEPNWIMAYVHLAHDCQVGNHTIFANNAQLAGHVQVGDWAILGGHSGVHQFCKIGAHAMLGMFTSLTQDVPPFVILSGNPAAPHGVNVEGLRRRGFSREEIDAIRNAYRLIYKSGLTLDEAKLAIANEAQSQPAVSAHLNTLLEFLESVTRGIVR